MKKMIQQLGRFLFLGLTIAVALRPVVVYASQSDDFPHGLSSVTQNALASDSSGRVPALVAHSPVFSRFKVIAKENSFIGSLVPPASKAVFAQDPSRQPVLAAAFQSLSAGQFHILRI